MDDPDIPDVVKKKYGISIWDHWIVWNIPPDTIDIAENTIPAGAEEGLNTSKNEGYQGPCPPDREHRYFFKLYALDRKLTLPNSSTKKDVEEAMKGHILAKTELIGLFAK